MIALFCSCLNPLSLLFLGSFLVRDVLAAFFAELFQF